MFARTQAPPRVYYYRQRVNSAYWTPWEKVDLDIEGDHLIPVVWNSRLFLFWPMFMEKAESPSITIPSLANGGAINDQTRKYWDMKLAWSERKQGQVDRQESLVGVRADLACSDGAARELVQSVLRSRDSRQRSGHRSAIVTDTEAAIVLAVFNAADDRRPMIRYGGRSIRRLITQPSSTRTPSSADPDAVELLRIMFFFGGCYFDPQITPHGVRQHWQLDRMPWLEPSAPICRSRRRRKLR